MGGVVKGRLTTIAIMLQWAPWRFDMALVTANEAALLTAAVLRQAAQIAADHDGVVALLDAAEDRPELRRIAARVLDLASTVPALAA